MRRRAAAGALLCTVHRAMGQAAWQGRARRSHDALGRLVRHAAATSCRPRRRSLSEHALDSQWVEGVLAQARFVAQVAQLIMPPPARHAEELGRLPRPLRRAAPHPRRRALLARPTQHWLARAEQRFGVPPRDHRRHRRRRDRSTAGTWAAFASSMRWPRWRFDFPHRPRATAAPFFRAELEQFLDAARQREGCDPLAAKGSLRRRHGHAAVHAEQHQQVRGRLRRRRPHRPARQALPT